MTFRYAVRSGYANYFKFSGRASRPEYWWFVLFVFGTSIVLSAVEAVLFGLGPDETSASASLFQLASALPFIAAGWRRLHDIGRPGWILLLPTAIGLVIALLAVLGVAGFGVLISLGADPEVVTPAAGAGGFVALLLAIALQIAATIYMIVLLARRGEPGPNAWGPPPG